MSNQFPRKQKEKNIAGDQGCALTNTKQSILQWPANPVQSILNSFHHNQTKKNEKQYYQPESKYLSPANREKGNKFQAKQSETQEQKPIDKVQIDTSSTYSSRWGWTNVWA